MTQKKLPSERILEIANNFIVRHQKAERISVLMTAILEYLDEEAIHREKKLNIKK